MFTAKKLLFLATFVATIVTSSLVHVAQAEEMTYGLHKQQQATSTGDTANISPERLAAMQRQKDKYGYSVYAARKGVNSINNPDTSASIAISTTDPGATPGTANISPERLAVMQRQKDKYGFSVYAARKGVNSINNPGASASTTASSGASPDTANISPERLAAMQRQKDKYGFSVYAARKGVNSINNPATSTGDAPAPLSSTVASATTAAINTDTVTTSGADPVVNTSGANPVDPTASPDEGAAQSASEPTSAEGCAPSTEAAGCKKTYLRH